MKDSKAALRCCSVACSAGTNCSGSTRIVSGVPVGKLTGSSGTITFPSKCARMVMWIIVSPGRSTGSMAQLMTDVRNKRVTVAGLGRFGGGIAVTRWLVEQGAARVLVTDKDPANKLAESVKKLDGLPVEFRLGEHREEDFAGADLVVTSPALPPTNK